MCGIFAIQGNDVFHSELHSNGTLTHRGPDEYTHWVRKGFSLEFFRLAVTGADHGRAPVTSADGRWTCFFNGEIYNFRRLAKSHLSKKIHSDTQLLVEGVSRFGFDFFDLVRGMFAGFLVDNLNEDVFVFRDFFGEKPMFYTTHLGKMLFCSEFRSLHASCKRALELDQLAIYSYFRFGYIEEPRTIDARIKAIPKGTVSRLPRNSGGLELVKVIYENRPEVATNLSTLKEMLVTEALESDVEQAFLLSGGRDSQSLIEFLPDKDLDRITAFTLKGFMDSNEFDISRSQKFAQKRGIRHFIVEVNESEFISRIHELAMALDQPLSDLSSLGYFRLFEEIRRMKFKVAQIGHGVDEMFWGYDWYTKKLLEEENLSHRVYWDTPANFTHLLDSQCDEFDYQKNHLLHPTDPYLHEQNLYLRARSEMCHSYLSHNGLTQIDRLAMTFSVEPRAPYANPLFYFWAQNYANSAELFSKRLFHGRTKFEKITKRKYRKKGFDIGMINLMKSPLFVAKNPISISKLRDMKIPLKIETDVSKLGSRQQYRLMILQLWLSEIL